MDQNSNKMAEVVGGNVLSPVFAVDKAVQSSSLLRTVSRSVSQGSTGGCSLEGSATSQVTAFSKYAFGQFPPPSKTEYEYLSL